MIRTYLHGKLFNQQIKGDPARCQVPYLKKKKKVSVTLTTACLFFGAITDMSLPYCLIGPGLLNHCHAMA